MNQTNSEKTIVGLGLFLVLFFGLTMTPTKATAQNINIQPYWIYEQIETPRKAPVAPKTTQKDVTIYNYKNMACSIILGSNDFVPSGLVQWLFVAILVLLGVIFVRKIFNVDKNYHQKPMKHD